ncbi:MAG: cation transporter [Candidatus Eisenbacteria bacterium]
MVAGTGDARGKFARRLGAIGLFALVASLAACGGERSAQDRGPRRPAESGSAVALEHPAGAAESNPAAEEHASAAGALRSVRLAVGGMHCDGCAASIQKALAANPGVKRDTVSFTDSLALVTYDAGIIDEAGLIRIVEASGYRAALLEAAAPPSEERGAVGAPH